VSVDLIPIGYYVRYDADGKTFGASSVVIHCLNDVAQVHLATGTTHGAFAKMYHELVAELERLGYKRVQYIHNGNMTELDIE